MLMGEGSPVLRRYVATSPVSLGVTRATIGVVPDLLEGVRFLDEARDAGYDGVQLGEDAYLGVGVDLAGRLIDRGLGVCGASLDVAVTGPEVLRGARRVIDGVLDTLDVLRGRLPGPAPHVVLGDAGDPWRRANPGVAHLASDTRGPESDDRKSFHEGVRAVVTYCREREFDVLLRPRVGSLVEAPREIDAVLIETDIGLCLDTGQILLGGGDPVAVLREWGTRVGLVYLKDANLARMRDVIDLDEPSISVWSHEVVGRLGDGDVDLVGVLQQLEAIDYPGWIVVEQDVNPQRGGWLARALDDQRRNREFLHRQGI